MDCFYKVVSQDLKSAIIKLVDYKIGLWVEPEFGKLFVFNNLVAARSFAVNNGNDKRIFYCSVKNPKFASLASCFYSKEELIDFWNSNPLFVQTRFVPDGTRLCDAVKLEHEVSC